MNTEARIVDMANAIQDRRAHLLADAAPHQVTWARCPDCAEAFARRKGDHVKRCPACAWRRQVEGGLAGARRSGETYVRTVRNQLAFWRAECERLGITPD